MSEGYFKKNKKCKILLLLWTKSIQVTIVMEERKNYHKIIIKETRNENVRIFFYNLSLL